jgi:hypothetical protein
MRRALRFGDKLLFRRTRARVHDAATLAGKVATAPLTAARRIGSRLPFLRSS